MTGTCRFCCGALQFTFCDLGVSPLSNALLKADRLRSMEPFYPLHAYVCDKCFLVQVEEVESPREIFSDYVYFSSYSDSWLRHCRDYTRQMEARFGLDASSQVIEIASNDGYLLQYFAERGIPVLGVEPAGNVAKSATEKGIPTIVRFFSVETATEMIAAGRRADLLLGNNVLAHVPDINDFVKAMAMLLKPGGVITMEFPHLLRLIQDTQFDTIYHEHFSYFSLLSVERIFSAHRLQVFDVDRLDTHGGSLRIYCRHANGDGVEPNVLKLRRIEADAGLTNLDTYTSFGARVAASKRDLLDFLIEVKRRGGRIAAYGAPAKGNTLLNYCGIGRDFIDFTVDRSSEKQGRYLPGTRIPVHAPETIFDARPDYLLILPWNIREEIIQRMSGIRDWGGKFVIPIPAVEVVA